MGAVLESTEREEMLADKAAKAPKQWPGHEQFIADLRRCRWKEWLQDTRAREAHKDWRAIIEYWVGPNTFRAFRHMQHRPSEVFRAWAYQALIEKEHRLESLKRITSAEEYDVWLSFLGLSLRRHWQDEMGTEMSYGHSLKLPNLLMKGVCVSEHLPNFSDRLFGYLHVPLDSFSIIAVRNCLDGFPLKAEIGPIPANASMGMIKSPEIYQAFQLFMRSLAKRAGVPPIAIDILAWDHAH